MRWGGDTGGRFLRVGRFVVLVPLEFNMLLS